MAPLLPGDEAPLTVRYVDADGQPLAGRSVAFDLSETRSGASLSPSQVSTGDDGYARATLYAGTSTAMFSVRVTAEGADTVAFQITVGNPVPPVAHIEVSYEGERKATSVSLTLVPEASCQDAAAMGSSANADSQVIYKFDGLGQGQFDLDADVSYALLASARNDTNAKLASGCTEFDAPSTADADEASLDVRIALADVPLALADAYAVALSLDLQQPLAQLAPAAASAVSAALAAGPAAAGTFYLDAVAAQLPTDQVSAFAEARAGGLDQALATLLDNSETGPLRIASELSSLVSALGPSCSVQASYSAEGAGSFRVDRLFALPSPALGAGAKAVDLRAGALSGAAALRASYDEASAELRFESLSFELGLGSYAGVLLDGARADAANFAARLAAAHGCASLGILASTPSWPVAITPAVAVAACEQAAAGLVERIEAAWQVLDAAHPSVWLSGSVSVHDRDDDGVVDDLGPSALHGSWSSAPDGPPGASVGATLRVPAADAAGAL